MPCLPPFDTLSTAFASDGVTQRYPPPRFLAAPGICRIESAQTAPNRKRGCPDMKEYPAEKIRNVALIGHGSTGKTSLSEALIFVSGGTNRLGKIEDGTTTSDWDPDEQKRGFSLNLSILPVEWGGYKVNILDTPGYMDFMGEVKCGLRAADVALITVDAVSGAQVGTEFAWRFADEAGVRRAVFINRMDRENADFAAALSQVQALWGQKCAALQIPIGSQAAFQGVIDLLTMKA